MRLTAICSALVIGLSIPAVGEEIRPNAKVTTTPPPPPGYKLDLSPGLNTSNTPAPPPGTSTLTRENKRPFMGLKLTKPLGN